MTAVPELLPAALTQLTLAPPAELGLLRAVQLPPAASAKGTAAVRLPDSEGGRLWIITEADRSATTLLLPDEY
jgi:hypothetical protein